MKKEGLISIFFYIFLVLYSIIGSSLIDAGNDYQAQIVTEPQPVETIVIFFIGALLETLIFNLLIVYGLKKIFKEKISSVFIVVIAGLIFGLAHFSSVKFFIITAIVGFILNANFMIYLQKYDDYFWAFFATFLVHFLSNLSVFIIAEVMNLV